MNRKISLTLIELLVMLFVLALCAAICLEIFVWADLRTEENASRDAALVALQNTAEILKYCHGDLEEAACHYGGSPTETGWKIPYGEYTLLVERCDSGLSCLGRADLKAVRGDQLLAELTVSWQEVSYGA